MSRVRRAQDVAQMIRTAKCRIRTGPSKARLRRPPLGPWRGSDHDLFGLISKMIQKGLAFRRERSGTVTVPGALARPESFPAGLLAIAGLRWWRRNRRRNRMEGSVNLTDTQRRLLAAASQRDDRALEQPGATGAGSGGPEPKDRVR
jgi:hypothetical protein